jgi:guanylate kinase
MSELNRNHEVMPVSNPAFFLCAGVSGAGCTTAIIQSNNEGLAQLGPTQFATRALRPTETRGVQYYPVTEAVLSKVPQQIALEDTIYGNRYGFFKPAIEKIRRALGNQHNVILNAENTPDEWRAALGDNYDVVSLFFAPSAPEEAIRRIIVRAEQGGQSIDPESLAIRRQTNTVSVKRAFACDYWIDSTTFEGIMPALKTVINNQNRGESNIHEQLISVRNDPDRIQALVQAYANSG